MEPQWTYQRPTGFCISALASCCRHNSSTWPVTPREQNLKHNSYTFYVSLLSGEMYQHQIFEVRLLPTIGTYIHDIHDIHTHTYRHADIQTDIQTYDIITIHYIETYRHKNIQTCYIRSVPFFLRRFQEDITQNLYTLILLFLCALGLKAK